jgi:4'-phosphopantetheinyl transferase
LTAPAATVWLLDGLAMDAAAVSACESWLGASERQRLAGFVRVERRRQFVLGRGLLRAALAPLLGRAPADIFLIERRAHAPLLDLPQAGLPCFSLSHSGQWIACAVSARAPIGLDIERLDQTRDVMAPAAQVFDSRQQALLAGLAPAARVTQFYLWWSSREAHVKLGLPAVSEAELPHPALSIVLCSAHNLDAAPALSDGAALLRPSL